MSRVAVKPFLIAKDESGEYRITIRETRYNSQGYPLITATAPGRKLPQPASAAKAHARDVFGAEAGQYATK